MLEAKRAFREANKAAGIVTVENSEEQSVTAEEERDKLNDDIQEAKAQKKSIASIIAKFIEK